MTSININGKNISIENKKISFESVLSELISIQNEISEIEEYNSKIIKGLEKFNIFEFMKSSESAFSSEDLKQNMSSIFGKLIDGFKKVIEKVKKAFINLKDWIKRTFTKFINFLTEYSKQFVKVSDLGAVLLVDIEKRINCTDVFKSITTSTTEYIKNINSAFSKCEELLNADIISKYFGSETISLDEFQMTEKLKRFGTEYTKFNDITEKFGENRKKLKEMTADIQVLYDEFKKNPNRYIEAINHNATKKVFSDFQKALISATSVFNDTDYIKNKTDELSKELNYLSSLINKWNCDFTSSNKRLLEIYQMLTIDSINVANRSITQLFNLANDIKTFKDKLDNILAELYDYDKNRLSVKDMKQENNDPDFKPMDITKEQKIKAIKESAAYRKRQEAIADLV